MLCSGMIKVANDDDSNVYAEVRATNFYSQRKEVLLGKIIYISFHIDEVQNNI